MGRNLTGNLVFLGDGWGYPKGVPLNEWFQNWDSFCSDNFYWLKEYAM